MTELKRSFPEEFVWPDYTKGTIGNVPATVAALLGLPFEGLPPLPEVLWRPLAGGVKRVVLLIVDGLGGNLLAAQRPFLQPFLEKAAVSGQITSIFPSTTVAALSSIWTGTAPAQHGLAGLTMLFPEMGTIGDLIFFSPTFAWQPDALVDAGLDPTTFLHTLGVGQQFAAAGIPTHSFKSREYINSALSLMHGRGIAEDHGVFSSADMFVQMRQLLENQPGAPLYLVGYWPKVDSLSHRYSWTGASIAAELRAVFRQLQMEFLEPLSTTARQNTVFFLMADHGQIETPLAKRIFLEDHPALRQMLLMQMTGEPRVVYMYAKQGRIEDVLAYINEHLSRQMIAWRSEDALNAGLFGPPPYAPQTAVRIGDVMAVMRDNYAFFPDRKAGNSIIGQMQGRHGGLSIAEMTVPWLGWRLDAY